MASNCSAPGSTMRRTHCLHLKESWPSSGGRRQNRRRASDRWSNRLTPLNHSRRLCWTSCQTEPANCLKLVNCTARSRRPHFPIRPRHPRIPRSRPRRRPPSAKCLRKPPNRRFGLAPQSPHSPIRSRRKTLLCWPPSSSRAPWRIKNAVSVRIAQQSSPATVCAVHGAARFCRRCRTGSTSPRPSAFSPRPKQLRRSRML